MVRFSWIHLGLLTSFFSCSNFCHFEGEWWKLEQGMQGMNEAGRPKSKIDP